VKAPELLESLEDFKAWRRDSPGFDLWDYVQCVGTPDHFFAFAELFCPTLIQHEGHYFQASGFTPALYQEWMDSLHDPIAVQKMMNHIHISSLFQEGELSNAVASEAAARLATLWNLTLAGKGLVAEAFGGDDAQVTFYAPKKL
jgi:hypothetical protein